MMTDEYGGDNIVKVSTSMSNSLIEHNFDNEDIVKQHWELGIYYNIRLEFI